MRVHFIAIGGSAMHNLALALHSYGHEVTGSDDEIFEPSKTRLAEKGLLPVKMGWNPDVISNDIDAIILGMHARIDNPELLRAQELGVKIYSYPEFIYNHSKDKTRVSITGSHGKTTITSMILHVLQYHNVSTDYMVGALIEGFDTMVKLTDDEFIVLEGDEYLSSPIDLRPKFLHYKPNIVLLSGIAWDHINVFPTYEIYKEQFALMLDSIEKGGVIIYNTEDSEVVDLVMKCTNEIKKFPYGLPDSRIEDGVTYLNSPEGEVPLGVFGNHNLNNLEGARWICLEMGIQEEEFYEAISSFTGAGKRLELIGSKGKSRIFKDFAHAPSKVSATVNAVKEQFKDHKVTAVLELHTFSSLTPEFIVGYKGAMDAADEAIVYFNPEAVAHKKLPPLSEEIVKEAFANKNILVTTDADLIFDNQQKNFGENDVLLIMTSGNFHGKNLEKVAQEILR